MSCPDPSGCAHVGSADDDNVSPSSVRAGLGGFARSTTLSSSGQKEESRRDRHRLHEKQNARYPESHSYRGHQPTARTLACLRFADPVTETVARLTTGSGGLTLGRAEFAPAGQRTKLYGVIAISPIPIDQQRLVTSEFTIRLRYVTLMKSNGSRIM